MPLSRRVRSVGNCPGSLCTPRCGSLAGASSPGGQSLGAFPVGHRLVGAKKWTFYARRPVVRQARMCERGIDRRGLRLRPPVYLRTSAHTCDENLPVNWSGSSNPETPRGPSHNWSFRQPGPPEEKRQDDLTDKAAQKLQPWVDHAGDSTSVKPSLITFLRRAAISRSRARCSSSAALRS
jgi:hypothetical protein